MQPIRAVWVTRYDYQTREDVNRIITDCQDAGFNTVLFQVRGNGTVFYPSDIEPWAEQFGFQDPGFDPLQTALDAAHARGLALHAWVNVTPAWRGMEPPADQRQLYHARPEWFWYDQHGQRQALSWFYVSLNPCLPEVREYLVRLFRELVTRYDLDGLHLDYIRFPNEPPATPEGSGLDYPRDARTLALYHEATGLGPDDDPEAWNQWRTDQVTRLVADIRTMMNRERPDAILSAAVGANRQASLAHFRDGRRWAQEKLVDWVLPMNYQPDLERFDDGLAMWLPAPDGVRVVPGIWFDRRLPAEPGTEIVRQQIESSLDRTGNFCLFAYASLYESRDQEATHMMNPAESARARAEHERARQIRRARLLPYLQGAVATNPPAR